ncbi:MAG: hypothetical protein ABW186_14245 [Rhodanobacteraceae bacterium]
MSLHALLRSRLLSMLVVASLFVAASSAQAADDRFSGGWHGAFTVYGWLPGVSADLRFEVPGTGIVTTRSENGLFDKLEGALMIQGEVRNGDWGFFGDVDWVKFGDQKGRFTNIGGEHIDGSANLDSRWDIKGGMVTLAGLYNINNGTWGFNDILFGGRYLWIKSNLSWNFSLLGDGGLVDIENSGHVSRQTHATDAVVGLRGRWNFGDGHWYVPYYVDAGAGDDTFTAQALVGVGYAFDWGGMTLAWRHVHYTQDDDSELLKQVDLDGPALGLTWVF